LYISVYNAPTLGTLATIFPLEFILTSHLGLHLLLFGNKTNLTCPTCFLRDVDIVLLRERILARDLTDLRNLRDLCGLDIVLRVLRGLDLVLRGLDRDLFFCLLPAIVYLKMIFKILYKV
jgi:hypothetical protein